MRTLLFISILALAELSDPIYVLDSATDRLEFVWAKSQEAGIPFDIMLEWVGLVDLLYWVDSPYSHGGFGHSFIPDGISSSPVDFGPSFIPDGIGPSSVPDDFDPSSIPKGADPQEGSNG